MTDDKIARSLLTALETGDFTEWQALQAPGFTCSYHGMRGDNGRDAALAFNQVFPPAFPDLKFTVTGTARSGNRIYLSWTASGTHLGPLMSPDGALPASGRHGTVDGVLMVEIAGGKLLREETYWNIPDLIGQLTGLEAAA